MRQLSFHLPLRGVWMVPTLFFSFSSSSSWFLLLLLLVVPQPQHDTTIHVRAVPVIPGLSDPERQPKFQVQVPNPLAAEYVLDLTRTSSSVAVPATTTTTTAVAATINNNEHDESQPQPPQSILDVSVGPGSADTGLVGPDGVTPVSTPIWGYGTTPPSSDNNDDDNNDDDAWGGRNTGYYTWPGRTFVVHSDEPLYVQWRNQLPIAAGYLLTGLGDYSDQSVVDTSFHYCYNLPGYTNYTIEMDGTPIVPHLHGGRTDAIFDGNSEAFFTPDYAIKGPFWSTSVYAYENSQPAAALWYHDHALGLTRLNVYAGMAGFYIIRDELDTGRPDNPLKLPVYPYELPLLIQDRMFKANGELFYPAFPGDPYYADFITQQGAKLPDPEAPTVLAEFFGDHMVVNGKIWPRADVEPRQYRLRLLNGCDSRFLVLRLLVLQDDTDNTNNTNATRPLVMYIIGGDQGLAKAATIRTKVVLPPSARLDVIVDFAPYAGRKILLYNDGGDEPFGGDIPGPQLFNHTDKIMRFDVSLEVDRTTFVAGGEYDITTTITTRDNSPMVGGPVTRKRRLGLFEGTDQYGRLQPLLGTVDPATDRDGNTLYYPDDPKYAKAGLRSDQPMIGTMTWHSPTTENMSLNDIEEWEIWNLSADAHPIHLHLVHMAFVSRRAILYDSTANEDGMLAVGSKASGDGTYIQEQVLVQHDGTIGIGFRVHNPTVNSTLLGGLPEYTHHYPMDVVVALPGEVTTIRAKFDKLGEFNYHCHILAHEDHEMMRRFHVGELPLPRPQPADNQYIPPPVVGGDTETSTTTLWRGMYWQGSNTAWRFLIVYLPVLAWIVYWSR